MTSFPFGQTVTILTRTAGANDALGNKTYTSVPTVVAGAAFADLGSSEILGNQETVIDQPVVYLPAGTVVGPLDAVMVGAITYEVDGQPSSNTSPFTGWNPGMVVKLRRVEG